MQLILVCLLFVEGVNSENHERRVRQAECELCGDKRIKSPLPTVYVQPPGMDIEQCPTRAENWQQLYGADRCVMRCTKHEDCPGRAYDCVCDGNCGMSCVLHSMYFVEKHHK